MPKTRTPSPHEPLVPVDPSLKAAWTKLSAQLDALAKRETSDFDALWETVGRIVDHEPPLYFFGGFKTATEFYAERLHVDLRTATRNLRVARYATPQDEATYGTTNIDAALGYLEAKYGKVDGALPVAFARLRIPAKGSGAKTIPFAQASKVQIQAATRELLAKKAPRPKNAARAALETEMANDAALAHVVVHARDGFATFANVPLASLGVFARALLRTELPKVGRGKKGTKKEEGRKRKKR